MFSNPAYVDCNYHPCKLRSTHGLDQIYAPYSWDMLRQPYLENFGIRRGVVNECWKVVSLFLQKEKKWRILYQTMLKYASMYTIRTVCGKNV